MQIRILLGALALLATASCAAVETYPATNTQYFVRGALDGSYLGNLVALEGVITRIESGPMGKPLLQLTLPHSTSQKLWVGSLVADDNSLLEIDDTVRVLGYLTTVDPSDMDFLRVSGDRYLVLGFCILDVSEKKAMFLPAGVKDCEAWQAGTRPEGLR